MKAKELKEWLKDVDDNVDVFIRNSHNPFGNVQELSKAEESTVSFFGMQEPVVILNTESAIEMEQARSL